MTEAEGFVLGRRVQVTATTHGLNTVERTVALGEEALDWIKFHNTSAVPPYYEVWFTYAAGTNPALNRAVDACIQQHGTITDRDLGSIYEQHVPPPRTADPMRRAEASLGEEI